MTKLDGPSIIVPNQSLDQLVSGMHQGYCRERSWALIKAWGQELGLDAEEVESLIDVIENLNKSWEEKLEMKGKPKQCKWCRSTHISWPKQRVSTMDNSVQQYKTVDRDEKEQG